MKSREQQTAYQSVVIKLIMANVIVFAVQILFSAEFYQMTLQYFALTPALVTTKLYVWQFVTYLFLHDTRGFAHLFFNMYAVLIFGMPIEQEWGVKRFLFYYFFTGVGAGITIYVMSLITGGPAYGLPTIGASGAVFGLLLAFGILYPNAELLLFFFVPIKAKYLVVLYGALELFLELQGGLGNISHLGHLGGLFFGIVYFIIFRKHAISFRTKILQNRIMKNLEEHQRTLHEKSSAASDRNTEFKVNILKKLESLGPDALNDDEVQFIKYLRIMKDDDAPGICPDSDYTADDDYCRKCDTFDACFLRRVQRYGL
ncbi:MAG: rhomboid family intramembrane serine protease [Spirochaetes bacterium]|nr:rhomboid family intramembrane serine protease [Spirochaetota bacterium]